MQLSKVEFGYNPDFQWLRGLKFYSKDGVIVLETGYDWVPEGWYKTHTVYLEKGERVIGYKSRTDPDYPKCAYHLDF